MLRPNPEIERWFAQNQVPSGDGGGAGGRPVNSALAQALLAGIVRPEIGSSFQAPPIAARYHPEPPAPYPVGRGPIGTPPEPPGSGGYGGGNAHFDFGGAAKAAGLQKLGQGILGGLQDAKNKDDAKKAAQDAAKAGGLNPPAPFGTRPAPSAPQRPAPFGTPPNTPLSPVAPVSELPSLAARPDLRAAIPPVGPASSGVPIMAQGQPAPVTGGPSSGNAGVVYNTLTDSGATPQGAQGIIASLQGESRGLNPLSMNNSGSETGGVLNPRGSYGIGQWNGDRQADLKSFADRMGVSPSDINTQAGFLAYEMQNNPSYSKSWSVAADPNATAYDALAAHVKNYERPADIPGQIAERAKNLNQSSAAQPSNVAGGPAMTSPGQPQTGPAYSDDTWNNRPQFNYGGAAPDQPPLINGGQPGAYSMPGQQGMNDPGQLNPLAMALAAGSFDTTGAGQPPDMAPGIVALLQSDPFGFGGLFDATG